MERLFTKFSMLVVIALALQMDVIKGCLEKERIALLKIKPFFPKYVRESWVDDGVSDCCDWYGVECNTTTGRVMNLSLSYLFLASDSTIINFSLFQPFEELQILSLSYNLFQGWVDSRAHYSFRSLKQLKILDLGSNNFNSSILSYLNTITSLTTLILRRNDFRDFNPKQGGGLNNLRNLKLLDLHGNRISGSLQELGLTTMRNLKFLDLSDNSINGSLQDSGGPLQKLKDKKCPVKRRICKLKNLLELDVSQNNLVGPLPACLNNLTNIRALGLSSNQLNGSLPSVIANLTTLEYLSLGDNNFEGLFSFSLLANLSKLEIFQLSTRNSTLQVLESEKFLQPPNQLKVLFLSDCNLHVIPSFIMFQHSLESIDLSHNKLVGMFPTWLLHNNTRLQLLNLKNNSLTGILQLPNSTHGLLQLSVSNNNLNGQFPDNLSMVLPELLDLRLSFNSFEGQIPSSIDRMEKLRALDLSSNNFSSHIPRSFVSGCFSLEYLNLSHNNFHGEMLLQFFNMTQLRLLDLANNNLSGQIQDGQPKTRLLEFLNLSNNFLSGQIPSWIGNLSSLGAVLMSSNLLEGGIPVQLSNLKYLWYLDISKNKLSGLLASSFNLSSVRHVYMQKNAFSGSIPNAFFKNSALSILDLRDNEFFGSIPNQIDEDFLNLRYLLLGGNHLEGHIPHELCRLKNISILDLSRNKLNGTIPPCFINMLYWAVEGENSQISNTLFGWFGAEPLSIASYNFTLQLYKESLPTAGSYQKLKVEFVTKYREESYEGSILRYMVGLDLSSNELTGDIPSKIGYLPKIRALNLSHNWLSGSIPESFRNLKNIESLDLSNNKLSGRIPSQLTELHSLAIFNVSFNNLSGLVPNKEQFATFDESNYIGNPNLCGSQIKRSCSSEPTIPPPTPSNPGEEDDYHAIDMLSFYWSLFASYVTTILGLVLILYLNSYWRRQWFCFIDECIISCYCWILKNVFRR